MEITVDRTNTSEGDLVFTITVKEAHNAPFGEEEKNIMKLLDSCKKSVESLSEEENKSRKEVIGLIHTAKAKTFNRILHSLKFAISNQLKPKFIPICQEIYNWIYDNQEDYLKNWLSEFDPQRSKYYFDNDNHIEKDFEGF